ncbi:MAG: CBS domain-containing protein [Myxococcota bacterium]
MLVYEVMSQPVVTCRENDSLNEAARAMWEHDCGSIPVVDDHQRLTGIVTDRDICMAAYTQGKVLSDIEVSLAMAKTVISCRREEAVERAETLMSENQIRRIPVVDDENRLQGIVSLSDIAKNAPTSNANEMNAQVTHTLATICRSDHRAMVSV